MLKQRRFWLLAMIAAAAPGCGAGDFGFGVGPLFAPCTEAESQAASVKIAMSRLTLRAGESLILEAVVRNASGSSSLCLPSPQWSTTNPEILSITGFQVTAIRDGVATLKATVGAHSDSATIVVSTPSVASISVALADRLLVGQTARATFTARDSAGNTILRLPAVVQSSDTSKATVSASGMVTARSEGTVEISFIVEGRRASAPLAITRDAPAVKFSAISAGEQHTCGIAGGAGYPAGTMVCWGAGYAGQLGNGTTVSSQTPVIVSSGVLFSSLEAGALHTCALSLAGDAFCWGSNAQGELGDGTRTSVRPVPAKVSGSVRFVTLSAGLGHTCGLTADGLTYCWGILGQRSSTIPVRVQNVPKLIDLSSRDLMACGIGESGDAYCWGKGDGLLVRADYREPTKVSSGIQFRSISSGRNHSCGLTADGAAHCWGLNATGQISPEAPEVVEQPRVLSGGFSFRNVTAGGGSTCGVTLQGARCIGYSSLRNVPSGRAQQLSPVPREDEHPFTVMTGGGFHTCAIDNRGGVWCWGEQRFGAVGAGEGQIEDEPLQVRVPVEA